MSKRSRRLERRGNTKGKKKPFHFRFYHHTGRTGHPALIVYEEGRMAGGYVVTHHPAAKDVKSYALRDNPEILFIDQFGKPTRKEEQAYIRIRLREGKIGHEFSKNTLLSFELSEDDEKTLRKIIKARDEGKPYFAYLSPEEMSRIYPKK